jgi:hypothetical protein
MTDSETPLAPRRPSPPLAVPRRPRARYTFRSFISVFRRCARGINISSLRTAASTRVSFHVLWDLRV